MRRGRLEERSAVAAQIRKYLKEYGGLSLEDRWYRILNDDRANADQWLEAAAFIVQRSDYNDLPPAWAFTDSHAPKPGEAFHLRGEPLRSKTGPTVSELLSRRMKDLAERATGENWYFAVQKEVSLGLALGTWDGPAHIGELQRLMSALVDQYATVSGAELSKRPHLIGQVVSLTLKRCELEDKQALTKYAAWLRTVYNIDTAKLVEKLMEFPAFREQILRHLEDKSVVGTLVRRPASPDDKYDLKVENNIAAVAAGAPNASAAVVSISHNDTQAPRSPLQPVSFRTCDVYAWKLRGYEGAPRIELYWTEAERDAAVAACMAFLREHKGEFVYSPERAYKYTQ